jgi:alpha-tubulin suppressor-like RCC1 family protein
LVPTAQTIGAVAFASLFANAYAMTTCGLTAASELYCWGENYAGQVGDGTNATAYFPKKALLK